MTDTPTNNRTADEREACARAIAFHEHRNSTWALRWPDGPKDTVADRDGLVPFTWDYVERCRKTADAVLAALSRPTPAPVAEVERLREALRPFAEIADDRNLADHPDNYAPRPSRGRPCMADYRRARTALADGGEK